MQSGLRRLVTAIGRLSDVVRVGPRVAAVAGVVCLTLGAPGGPRATAEGLGERVLSFASSAQVGQDGSLPVKETIEYQFPEPRHGIVRSLVTRQRYDDAHERVFPLEVLSVTSPDGAPADYEVTTNGAVQEIRIGDPDVLVDGQHTYEISYRLDGMLNAQPDAVELFWNATGNLTQVPTDAATVAVRLPGPISDITCYQGAVGSRARCSHNDVVGDQALFEADQLGPAEGLTVVVAFASDSVSPRPEPILEESHTLALGVPGSPARRGGAAVAMVAAAGGVGLLA